MYVITGKHETPSSCQKSSDVKCCICLNFFLPQTEFETEENSRSHQPTRKWVLPKNLEPYPRFKRLLVDDGEDSGGGVEADEEDDDGGEEDELAAVPGAGHVGPAVAPRGDGSAAFGD